jgi:N-succinyldiaminopimelate aminotransferase
MPAFPATAAAASSLRPSVFASLAGQLKSLPQPPIPLHLGDTYRPPPAAARLETVATGFADAGYAYSSPLGHEGLRDAVAERCARDGLPGFTRQHVHVSVGATGAIHTALSAWLQPGDEVLVCAPFWPLVKGMILSLGAVPVEVPFYAAARRGAPIAEILRPYVSARTTALYVTTPNNPCGTVLTAAQLHELAAFCVARKLWVVADEAYHHYAYAPAQHTFLATLPDMAERTATVFTVSKSYALAGARVGFLCGDPAWLETARRVATHVIYNVPLVCQLQALAAIQAGDAWIAETRDLYREARDAVVRDLDAKFDAPDGGGYAFVDLGADLAGRPLIDWLGQLLRDGVSLSPGDAFGKDYGTWVRVCFTAVPLPDVRRALDRLNGALHRLNKGDVMTGAYG